MQFLEKNEYHTDDPYVKEIINEEIRKELAINLGQNDPEDSKTKKGKSAQQQTLMNLKSDGQKFKYLWSEEGIEEIDYEQEEDDHRRNRQMLLTQPERFQVIGYIEQKGDQKRGRLRKRPILRMTDLYLTSNPKMKRLINHVFDRHIYGKVENKKVNNDNIITSNCASNSNELELILKKYQNNQQDYNFENLQLKLDQQQLEEYIIDHNQSKSNYFLFYKHEHPAPTDYQVQNHPLASLHFLQNIHSEVKQLEARKHICSQIEEEGRDLKKDWQDKKVKDYFGQFKKTVKVKLGQKCKIKDIFNDSSSSKHQIAKNIHEFYSYVDNDILQETYKKSLSENDRLELNLNNPYFFQTKLHTIMNKEREIIRDDNINSDLKTNLNMEHSMSLEDKAYKLKSGLENQRKDMISDEGYEEDNTIEKVIEAQIRNVYKEPLKHSEVATKFQYVKFTLEEECFNLYHKFYFGFQEHLHSGRVRVEVVQTKRRKDKPNRLIINSEMKQSNEKFTHKEDLSLANKDEFIMVQYIEETPLLISDVGMCERMIVQVNHQKIVQTIHQETLHNKSLEEMEEEIQENKANKLTFDAQCELWRKKIKDLFGPNGKQYFWDPKKDGKLIGMPDGPGVTIMESNLCNIPIVKKQKNHRDFLLVRDGKRWVLRKIDWTYVSGQTEPNTKVFCPGSRQHTEFKLSYQKAFVIKQIKEYGSVNFDLLKLTFKGETENSLRKALKNANAISKDSKNYKLSSQNVKNTLIDLSPQDVCIYQRMQKSLCQLREVGISQIKSNEKMKNVLKEFNKKHFLNQQKITIARMIREQLQLTSWYLTDSFLKYKQKASKIQINGFADPTNGKGGYSYINKPQKERTSKQDMEDKVEKNKNSQVRDLRKLKVDASKQLLRQMGHNQDEIEEKGRWALINVLKNKEGTEYSRRERQTKYKKIENEKKDISKNFNRLLNYLNDKTEEPAFDYKREKKNKLANFIIREKQYWQKIKRKFSKPIGQDKDDNRSQDSDQDD